MKKKIAWESQHIEEPVVDDDGEYSDDDEGFDVGNVIMTPTGMYRVDDTRGNPYKVFDMWMGHTNFPLDAATVEKIATTPGVEVLEILTPYRMLVAPGKLFEWSDVAQMIQKRVCVNEHDRIISQLAPDIQNKVYSVVNGLKDTNFWRLYLFPNREIYHKSYKSLSEYQGGMDEFAALKKDSNGIIITSD